jgi:hypothetical protein
MHVRSLEIRNFKAVECAALSDLPMAIVIAGPNGCGKSCLLDALRIWKAAYGGYTINEFDQAFSEFGVNPGQLDTSLPSLFRDRTLPIVVIASITLSDEERSYLRNNADDLIARRRRREQGLETRGGRRPTTAHDRRVDQIETDTVQQREVGEFEAALVSDVFVGEFRITPSLQLFKTPNPVLQLIYSMYMPEVLGVFEYHSAYRSYQQREEISNVDLRIEVAAEQQGQQALFNWMQKYQNVKTQLVGSYVRELIANAAGAGIKGKESLIESLAELFRLFFPDKQFLGVLPTKDGRVTLNIRTASGIEHDITDLSSGEKEVLYGYLRMRNLAPRHSVLLLDEPELHLNPSLIGGLPQFYRTHLGKIFSNQIWLVTHSDVLLEKALDVPDYAVYHMLPADASKRGENQLVRVTSESLDRAIIDLVGEKAAYRPKGTLVIFEGGGDSDFDRNLACELFPELRLKTNPISGTNRNRVVGLRRLLEAATASGHWRPKVFSITDRDSAPYSNTIQDRELSWDVYHIENYLLEPKFVLEALQESLREKCTLQTPHEVDAALKEAASAAIGNLVTSQITQWARQELFECLDIGCDPSGRQLAKSLSESATSSVQRALGIVNSRLTAELIQNEYALRLAALKKELVGDGWRSNIPGRTILKQFANAHGVGLSYETIRNLVIARMRADGHQPLGMKRTISEVLAG